MVFSSSLFLVLCALAFGQLATCVLQQQPFNATDWNSSTVVPKENETSYPGIFMVSIIGAGAAGSSAAYWLSLANKRLGMNMGITVYENSSWIGGRSTVVHPYDDETLPPIELGASIFVKENRNMMRATKEFNLTLRDHGDKSNRMGIWDGCKFVLELGPSEGAVSSWWNSVRVAWRYGSWNTLKTKSVVAKMLKNFVTVYNKTQTAQWRSVKELAEKLDIVDSTTQTAEEYLKAQGVEGKFVDEMVDAATRANYGQDVSDIHGFGGLVSLSAEGASRVREGNYKIFESFLNQSIAHVARNTFVNKVTSASPSSKYIHYTSGGRTFTGSATVVIIAAPLHSINFDFSYPGHPDGIPEDRARYVHLHTTLLTTTAQHPLSEYFYGPGSTKAPPRSILTTGARRRHGEGAEPEFNAMAYLDIKGVGEKGESVVKIFSKKRISDEWLANMFGSGNVGWVHRKEWDAYPYLTPTAYFTPIRLAEGIYYINGMESLVSTMETETVAARNVVDMILEDRFGQSICPRNGGEGAPWGEDKVYGWDCY